MLFDKSKNWQFLGFRGKKYPVEQPNSNLLENRTETKTLVQKQPKIIFHRIVQFCEKIGIIVHITWIYVSNLGKIMLSLFPFM